MRTRGVRGGGGGSSVCVCLLAPCDSAAAPVSGEFSSEPPSAHSPTASRVSTAAGLPGRLAGWPARRGTLFVCRPASRPVGRDRPPILPVRLHWNAEFTYRRQPTRWRPPSRRPETRRAIHGRFGPGPPDTDGSVRADRFGCLESQSVRRRSVIIGQPAVSRPGVRAAPDNTAALFVGRRGAGVFPVDQMVWRCVASPRAALPRFTTPRGQSPVCATIGHAT